MSYKNGRLPKSALKKLSWCSWRLTKSAAASAERLNKAFKAKYGRNMLIDYGYRSYAQQVLLWNRYGHNPGRAAYPGTSNHGLGIALDIGGLGGFDGEKWKWIANHPSYGWRRSNYAYTRQHEPWHWEYHPGLDLRRGGKGKVTATAWGYSKAIDPKWSKAKRQKFRKYTRKPGYNLTWTRREYVHGVWWCVTSHGTWYRAKNISNQP